MPIILREGWLDVMLNEYNDFAKFFVIKFGLPNLGTGLRKR